MSTEHRIGQLDKIIAISAARKLRKQAALQSARADLATAELERDDAECAVTNANQTLQDARRNFALQAASDQAMVWRTHCEGQRDIAQTDLRDAVSLVENMRANVQLAIDDLLRHNFRHDRITEHAAKVKRQQRNYREARTDDEFTDSRSGQTKPIIGGGS
jgi:hypothetical protein